MKSYSVTAEMITPIKDVTMEYTIPVKVLVSYTDDLDEEKTETQSVPLLLRPKMFMEITNDFGIWIGDFFIAPYVSIGTIVGIPAGTILSLMIRRAQNKNKKQKKSFWKKGLGSKIIVELEKITINHRIKKIFLNSRESAIRFYQNNGYHIVNKVGPTFGNIIHYRMEKVLDN